MKAITIWQPWATLIARHAKPYEFRGWRPPRSIIGQRIAIHAGTRPMRRDEITLLLLQLQHPALYGQPCVHTPLALPILEAARNNPRAAIFQLSHVVCTAVVGEPKSGEDCAAEFGQAAGNDSDREGTFNWGWPLTDILSLEPPVPARGAQGLWEWTP